MRAGHKGPAESIVAAVTQYTLQKKAAPFPPAPAAPGAPPAAQAPDPAAGPVEDVVHEWAGDLYEEGDETDPAAAFSAGQGQEGEQAWLDRADDGTLTGWVRDSDGSVYRYSDADAWAIDVDQAAIVQTVQDPAATGGGPGEGDPAAGEVIDPATGEAAPVEGQEQPFPQTPELTDEELDETLPVEPGTEEEEPAPFAADTTEGEEDFPFDTADGESGDEPVEGDEPEDGDEESEEDEESEGDPDEEDEDEQDGLSLFPVQKKALTWASPAGYTLTVTPVRS